MKFLWTGRRERTLIDGRADGFTFRECARMIGCGCTEADARARMKVIAARKDGAPLGDRRYAANRREVEDRPTPAPSRASGLIPLPKYGEMEKTYDPFTRAKLGIG